MYSEEKGTGKLHTAPISLDVHTARDVMQERRRARASASGTLRRQVKAPSEPNHLA